MVYNYAIKITKWPKNVKTFSRKEKTANDAKKKKKFEIRISPLKFLLHEINYVFGKHCLNSKINQKKDALCIEIRDIVIMLNQHSGRRMKQFYRKKCFKNGLATHVLWWIIYAWKNNTDTGSKWLEIYLHRITESILWACVALTAQTFIFAIWP